MANMILDLFVDCPIVLLMSLEDQNNPNNGEMTNHPVNKARTIPPPTNTPSNIFVPVVGEHE